jgi:hypothetical protein
MSEFTHEVAKPGNLPLAISIAGYAKSGKTKSALRIAKGIQQARGGDIWGLDSENRMHEYGDQFTFQRVAIKPPFSPQRYQGAIQYAYDNGARIMVIDSMSDEHDGEGGLLDMHENFLRERTGSAEPSEGDRGRYGQQGWARVKPGRKRLENYIRRLRDFEDVVFVLCYRATMKYVPKTKDDKLRMQAGEVRQDPTDVQWEVSSTSDIPFICSVSLLLIPGENGSPLIKATTEAEKKLILGTDTYKPYLQTVKQLDESVGRKLYELAKGAGAKTRALMFNRSYGYESTSNPSGTVNDATSDERATYLHWLGQREVPANARAMFETHLAAVAALVESDRAERALEGAAE